MRTISLPFVWLMSTLGYGCLPSTSLEQVAEAGTSEGTSPAEPGAAAQASRECGQSPALTSCRAACKANDAAACTRMGRLHIRGEGGAAKGDELAEPYLLRGCELGDGSGCATIGGWRGNHGDAAGEQKYLQKACDLKDFHGCWSLGEVFFDARNGVKAAELFQRTCESPQDHWKTSFDDMAQKFACADLGDLLYWGDFGVPKNEAQAVVAYRSACPTDGGYRHAQGCFRLGQITIEARLVAKDDDVAIEYLTRGCEQYSEACDKLGDLMLGGKLSRPLADRVRSYLTGRCQESKLGLPGYTPAATETCLILGDVLAKDNPSEAKRLWGLVVRAHMVRCRDATGDAAPDKREQGSQPAEHCTAIGHLARTGKGMTRDPKAAVEYYGRACTLGSARGCLGAGILTRDGQGTAKDPDAARGLFTKACNYGDHDGCTLLAAMK